MRNKRGIGMMETMIVMMVVSAVTFGTASAAMKNPNAFSSFKARKALKYCGDEGGAADACKDQIAGMTKVQIDAYVRDTAERPRF